MTWDFRSDTVTKPSDGMRKAMQQAKVGDDVYREDPTVNRLEHLMAERFGMDEGVFTTSGTQANLVALMAHCSRGDEYIVGQQAHTYKYEGGGAAVLGSIQPQPLEFCEDGSIDLDAVRRALKPLDDHFARTRLLCLENTQAGRALSMEYLQKAKEFTIETNLGFHLDGARVFNAAIFHNVDVADIVKPFDSSTCCFSKGLGAPVGSIVCGNRDLMNKARRWRKLLGGGMRQAGVIAAAALYALEHNIERLAEDHDNARWLAKQLEQLDEIEIRYHPMQTNMVFIDIPNNHSTALAKHLSERSILVPSSSPMRLVTHLDTNRNAAKALVAGIKEYFAT